jgi:hypothetical protein
MSRIFLDTSAYSRLHDQAMDGCRKMTLPRKFVRRFLFHPAASLRARRT